MFRDRIARAAILVLVGLAGLPAALARGQSADASPPAEPAETATVVPSPVEQPYFDLDAYLDNGGVVPTSSSDWDWQLLPNDLIYKSYLAGIKEPRSGTVITNIENDGWVWEGIMACASDCCDTETMIRCCHKDSRSTPKGRPACVWMSIRTSTCALPTIGRECR